MTDVSLMTADWFLVLFDDPEAGGADEVVTDIEREDGPR